MGLLDILNGMQNGPRGNQDTSGKGGMSPLTMALLALLAYKAYKHVAAGQSGTATTPTPAPAPGGGTIASGGGGVGGGLGDILGGMLGGNRAGGGLAGGGLGDLLKGGLGGLLAGGAAGGILSGGLGDLLKQLQQSGQGDTANSWVGHGENKPISPGDLSKALGEDQIGLLMQHSGMSRNDLLDGLSQALPKVVDQLTPQGRVPTEQEASRMI